MPHRLTTYSRPFRVAVMGVILCLLFFAGRIFALPVQAAESAPDEEKAGAVYLCNLENNLVLHEKNSSSPVYPASSVKIMTGLLACRTLSDRLGETVTVTSAMLAGSTGRRMGLVDGEKITIEHLLYATLCGGYNDAACVLAYLTAGSAVAFVEEMNREAIRVGASSTVYTNPTGLFDAAMVTTAADTALIAREAWKNDLFMTISSAVNHTIPATNASEERYFSNRNALLSDTSGTYYNGRCHGMNAGMIEESLTGIGGWCVVTVWERDGASNLVIVMEAADVALGEVIPAYRYTNRLLSWVNRTYGYRQVLTKGEVWDTHAVAMTGTSKSETDLVIPHDVSLYLPLDADLTADVSYAYTLNGGELIAPLTGGERVGTLTVSYDGQVVGTSPLIVTESFERNGFLDFMASFRRYLTSRVFVAALVIFVILLLLYLKWTTGPGRRYGIKRVKRTSARRYRRRRFRR